MKRVPMLADKMSAKKFHPEARTINKCLKKCVPWELVGLMEFFGSAIDFLIDFLIEYFIVF